MYGTSRSTAIQTLSTSMSATSGKRSTGPSGIPLWRPSEAWATVYATSTWMHLPLKLRLTLVFGVGMAVVFVGLGTYGYRRVEADLLASVDAGLRPRAQALANSVGRSDEANGGLAEGKLIGPDEGLAQVLHDSGRIVDASSAVSSGPLLKAE